MLLHAAAHQITITERSPRMSFTDELFVCGVQSHNDEGEELKFVDQDACVRRAHVLNAYSNESKTRPVEHLGGGPLVVGYEDLGWSCREWHWLQWRGTLPRDAPKLRVA